LTIHVVCKTETYGIWLNRVATLAEVSTYPYFVLKNKKNNLIIYLLISSVKCFIIILHFSNNIYINLLKDDYEGDENCKGETGSFLAFEES
jgi:hypothetical protein